MAFDIKKIQAEAAAAPIHSPLPEALAVAAISDCFRDARKIPPPEKRWRDLMTSATKLWPEQLGMLAHLLLHTSLGEATVVAVAQFEGDLGGALRVFQTRIEPLTAEMIRANPFRQEEFIRRWAQIWRGEISGETSTQADARAENLDYRKALDEFARAEAARKSEAGERRKRLEEAAARAAEEARGWRE